MAVECHVNGCVELAVLEGFDDVAERLGLLCPFQRLIVGMGGQVDHRKKEFRPDPLGGLDPVDRSAQRDIDENQVRTLGTNLVKSFLS